MPIKQSLNIKKCGKGEGLRPRNTNQKQCVKLAWILVQKSSYKQHLNMD